MWPDCPWVSPFDVTVTMRHWGDSFTGGSWMWCLCGWWVQRVVEGHHIMQALELVCRSIVWRQTVGVHTSMDYCLNTQLWRMKGVGFAIVWPQFIVHLLEPIILSVSVCVGTVSVDSGLPPELTVRDTVHIQCNSPLQKCLKSAFFLLAFKGWLYKSLGEKVSINHLICDVSKHLPNSPVPISRNWLVWQLSKMFTLKADFLRFWFPFAFPKFHCHSKLVSECLQTSWLWVTAIMFKWPALSLQPILPSNSRQQPLRNWLQNKTGCFQRGPKLASRPVRQRPNRFVLYSLLFTKSNLTLWFKIYIYSV